MIAPDAIRRSAPSKPRRLGERPGRLDDAKVAPEQPGGGEKSLAMERRFMREIGDLPHALTNEDEQKRRLESRPANPDKKWNETSTDFAPWCVIPANRKWHRNLVIARAIADTLESLDPQFPRRRRASTESRSRTEHGGSRPHEKAPKNHSPDSA